MSKDRYLSRASHDESQSLPDRGRFNSPAAATPTTLFPRGTLWLRDPPKRCFLRNSYLTILAKVGSAIPTVSSTIRPLNLLAVNTEPPLLPPPVTTPKTPMAPSKSTYLSGIEGTYIDRPVF